MVWPAVRSMGYPGGFLLAGLTCLTTACYLFYFVRRLPQGITRLIASSPVLIIYAYLPLIFERETQTVGVAILCGVLTWTASFKVLMFCWGFGPLLVPKPLPAIDSNIWAFTAVLSTPIRVHPNPIKGQCAAAAASAGAVGKLLTESRRAVAETAKSGSGQREGKVETWTELVTHSMVRLVMVIAGVIMVADYRRCLHKHVFTFMYAFVLNNFVGLVEEGIGALVAGLLKIQLLAHVDDPYLSTSHSDFWARRWHLTVSALLRESIYEPLMLLFHMLLVPTSSPPPPPPPPAPPTTPTPASPPRNGLPNSKVIEEMMNTGEAMGRGGNNEQLIGGVDEGLSTPWLRPMDSAVGVISNGRTPGLNSPSTGPLIHRGVMSRTMRAISDSAIRSRSSCLRQNAEEEEEEEAEGREEGREREGERREKENKGGSYPWGRRDDGNLHDAGAGGGPGDGYTDGQEEEDKRKKTEKNSATFRMPLFAQMLAAMASFFVSGVMHEMMLWYMAGTITWELASFFWVCGIIVCVEFGLRRVPSLQTLKVPRPIAIALTIGSLLPIAEMLFFPPLIRAGTDVAILRELRNAISCTLRI